MPTLAIDQGTTSTRALLLNEDGSSEIVTTIEHVQHYPQSGWVEHAPEELIQNIQLCINSSPDVSAIGIDNQGESCLAWHGETKQAVSPIIVWQDNRTQETIEKLNTEGAQEKVLEKAGLPLDSYFSASKLAWVLENIPEAKTLHHQGKLRLGTTDAFFLDRLSNRFVTDITTASRTSLMNIRTGQWDDELCELFGVPRDALPEIVPTVYDFGCVQSNGRTIPITASVVDQQASLYGHGSRKPGDLKITFGTGAFALALTGDQLLQSPEQGLLPTVAWQLDRQSPIYALDGGVYCAGSAVNWGRTLGLFQQFEEINTFNRPSAIERDIAFVPALSGLACPHWDRRAAGLWIGLSLNTQPADMMQALLEGIAFRAGEVVNAMQQFTQTGDTISIDGGLSANPYFCQFLANVLSRQITVQQISELTALGTAMLASNINQIQKHSCQCVKVYHPAENINQHVERFQEAVSRSRGWKL